jgi:hypothetical protein
LEARGPERMVQEVWRNGMAGVFGHGKAGWGY